MYKVIFRKEIHAPCPGSKEMDVWVLEKGFEVPFVPFVNLQLHWDNNCIVRRDDIIAWDGGAFIICRKTSTGREQVDIIKKMYLSWGWELTNSPKEAS